MSIVPSDKAVKLYVGSWGEWMESVGVSWEDAEDIDECEGCPVWLSGGEADIPKDCWKEQCSFKENEASP
jgi:hypothetical protein